MMVATTYVWMKVVKTHIALIIAIQALLNGCATNQLAVTYYSDPPGAMIIRSDGATLGRAPLTLNYSISDTPN